MIFKPELAEAILRREKTATRRKFSDNKRSPWWEGGCSYVVGQFFTINPGRGVARVGEAKVTKVYKQRLGGMGFLDAEKEGFRGFRGAPGPSARQQFIAAWCEINGSYDSAEEVWVIEFELAWPPA